MLSGESLVGTSVNGTLGGNQGIVRQEESPLTRVDHLVTLGRNGGNLSNVSGVLAVPFYAERVSAIL